MSSAALYRDDRRDVPVGGVEGSIQAEATALDHESLGVDVEQMILLMSTTIRAAIACLEKHQCHLPRLSVHPQSLTFSFHAISAAA